MPYKDPEKLKTYLENNKEKKKEYDRLRNESNRKEVRARNKSYNDNNPEKIKKYKEDNKEKIKSYQKSYRNEETNKAKRRSYSIKYQKTRTETDPAFKFINSLRKRQGHVLKGKSSTTSGLGCDREELLHHLESQFIEGMTIDNHGYGHGKWHIDHIFPLSGFEEDSDGNWDSNSEYNKLLIHFTNLQPLWHEDNLEKSSK